MNRQQAIDYIDSLYPIDSEFAKTNEIGKELLIESIEENDWRDLPEDILITYANKCIAKDNSRL